LRCVLAVLVTAAVALPFSDAAVAKPTANAGNSPTDELVILFNDRHVDARPTYIKSGRLLARLAHGAALYVPLRKMLAQLGATVSYDSESRTALIEKAGASIVLTVGVPQAIIDGQLRPLDVPPIMHDGDVLVPVRAIAEAMGAYVAYVPEKLAVVVRYTPGFVSPATVSAVPAPAVLKPLPRRAIVPPGPPIPVDTPEPETYVVAEAAISPKVYNAFSPGNSGTTGSSFDVRAATEFSIIDLPLVVDAEYVTYAYPHMTGPVTAIGSASSSVVPAFTPRDTRLDLHLGTQLSAQKYYVAVGYGSTSTTYGYPRVGGVGFGFEKLPLLRNKISYEASAFYYPHMSGACTAACPPGLNSIAYGVLTYRAGVTYAVGQGFVDAGFQGDRGYRKTGAPVGFQHDGAYAGLGVRL
jgi:Copper amine oxidase N-terminal domain